MERQTNRSLSPTDEATHIPRRQHNNSISEDNNGVPADLGDTSFDEFPPFVPSPRHGKSPKLEMTENEHQSKWARVEEVEDEETYPRYAREFSTSAEELGDGKIVFEEIFKDQRANDESQWAPIANKDEWELARWLAKNVNQQASEEFLKMSGVSFVNFSDCWWEG